MQRQKRPIGQPRMTPLTTIRRLGYGIERGILAWDVANGSETYQGVEDLGSSYGDPGE